MRKQKSEGEGPREQGGENGEWGENKEMRGLRSETTTGRVDEGDMGAGQNEGKG